MKSPLRTLLTALAILGASVGLPGCGRPAAPPPETALPDQPPHGGTAIGLGDGIYRIELVRDAGAGRIEAYILDDEMETFIRISDPSFEVIATVGGQKRPLIFQAVANPATGERVGATSEFSAAADWLRTADQFDGVITRLEVRSHVYSGVAFNFPKGNGAD